MHFPHKNAIHVVGKKNSGKSTLMQLIIREMTKMDYRVGALKHSSHHHALDREGSDSDNFRTAGTMPVAFSTPEGLSVVFSPPKKEEQTGIWLQLYRECDLVVVESFCEAEGPKLWLCTDEPWDKMPQNTIAIVHPGRTHDHIPVFKSESPDLIHYICRMLKTY